MVSICLRSEQSVGQAVQLAATMDHDEVNVLSKPAECTLQNACSSSSHSIKTLTASEAQGEQSVVVRAGENNASPEEGRLSLSITAIFTSHSNKRGRTVSTSTSHSRINEDTSQQRVSSLQVGQLTGVTRETLLPLKSIGVLMLPDLQMGPRQRWKASIQEL